MTLSMKYEIGYEDGYEQGVEKGIDQGIEQGIERLARYYMTENQNLTYEDAHMMAEKVLR